MKKRAKNHEQPVENQATPEKPAPAESQESPENSETSEASENSEESECTESSEESEKPENSEKTDVTESPAPTIEEQLQQAYLRGRNEAIEALMQRPAMMQPLPSPARKSAPGPEPEVMVLNNPRTSIWER